MTDFPDYQEPQANATALATTNLVGTGLAREAGGNLDTHTKLLGGTQAGALIANIGATIGQEVAAQIASGSAAGTPGGTPLLHGVKPVFTVAGQVIGPGASFSTGFVTVTKPGYVINIRANMGAVLAAVPFILADVEWRVNASGTIDSAEELWYIPGGNNTNRRTTGKGPTKGDRMQVTFTNGDAVNSVTLSCIIWETTQHIARDDWRSDAPTPSTTAGAIKHDTLANILANDSFNVNAATTQVRNLPLYSGAANIWISSNGTAGSEITIVPVGDFNLATPQQVASLDWTQPFRSPVPLTLPRCPCQLQAINTGAGAVTLQVSMTALEYAS